MFLGILRSIFPSTFMIELYIHRKRNYMKLLEADLLLLKGELRMLKQTDINLDTVKIKF